MSGKPASILIAINDEPLGWLLGECLRLYYRCETAVTAGEAAQRLRVTPFNLVIVDLEAGTASQLDLCRLIAGVYPQTQLLMILEKDSLPDATRLMARRRFDYLVKPVDLSRVLSSSRRALWTQALMAAQPSRVISLGGEMPSSGLSEAVRSPDSMRENNPQADGMTGSDRRKDERVAYLCEVQCEGANYRGFTTRINDISVGGVFIDSMISLRVGSILKLVFRVRSSEITVFGEVRYSIPRIGMGLRFVDLSLEHGEAIASVVGQISHTALRHTEAAGQSSGR